MTTGPRKLLLFTRFPEPGKVKTRLIPALGAHGAAGLHRRLVLRALRTAQAACRANGAQMEIHFDGADELAMRHWLGESWFFCRQSEGDLGQRMQRAFQESFSQGSTATVLIGSDCPGLKAEVLHRAFASLQHAPVVLGPATDGGYYLVGLTRVVPALFRGIAWGSGTVLQDSLLALQRIGLNPVLLEPLADIDRSTDLPVWRRFESEEQSGAPTVSVVIPALNEAAHIRPTLDSVAAGGPAEVIVVDGGSVDETRSLAAEAGARVLKSSPGRSRQMNAGAVSATGHLVLLLHADTLLPSNWGRAVREALSRPGVIAGAFRFQVSVAFPGRRFLEWATNWRSHWRQMPYGDQGLFLRRSTFEELGGFADLPILEDYELVRRLRPQGRILTLPESAVTSGRRWRRLGLLRTTLCNRLVIAGYRLGVDPRKLAGFYRNHR